MMCRNQASKPKLSNRRNEATKPPERLDPNLPNAETQPPKAETYAVTVVG